MYGRILREAMETPWAMTPRYLAIVQDLLRYRAQGGRLSAEELEARVGPAAAERNRAVQPRGTIAVIPIHGVICHRSFDAVSGMASAEDIIAMASRVEGDESISDVLLDIASPGGTCVGVPEAAAAIFRLRKTKQVTALVNGEMCSAAHWLGSQAHEVYSIPSGYCGSIGVYLLTEDWSEHLAKEGIKINFIHAGEDKIEGSRFWEPMSDDTRARLQAEVDQVYSQFVAAVAKGRGTSVSDVKKSYAGGRVFSAKDAVAAGMIDGIATAEDLVTRLMGGASKRGAGGRASGTSFGVRAADATAEACADCGGTGRKPESYMGDPVGQEPCDTCEGTGQQPTPASAGGADEPHAHSDRDTLELIEALRD